MNSTYILLQGALTVEAAGFWYTSGGEKGSFGYYPHLKDSEDHPVYPDTQIHGDLRMAAQWAANLGVECSSDKLIDSLFGKRGNETAALLHIGDLSLDPESRNTWSASRFCIKPRIEIEDKTRSVKKNMLANFEAAWLDKLVLEAPLYVGYFTDRAAAENAQRLLDEAAQLLSGFGALRSRGYGRGRVRIKWQQPKTVQFEMQTVAEPAFSYALESLVNLRSKPVAAEQLQLVATSLQLNADQIRGWFVRTFYQVVGRWPDAEEMASIAFSDFFPSPSSTEASYPPASTTLRREDGTSVDDYWGITGERPDDNENALKCKLKPLPPGTFVTAAGRIHSAKAGLRMRNAMQEDFRTLDEGGLFVQQYLPRGTVFFGQVSIAEPAGEFGRFAYAILSGLNPAINGTLLASTIGKITGMAPSNCRARLVARSILFNPSLEIGTQEGITIGTVRRYAPALGRPRRSRPAILPGSVLTAEVNGTVAWSLFGKNIATAFPKKHADPPEKPEFKVPLPDLGISWGDVTRSQAGILRELLNRDHNAEVIGKYLEDISGKHSEKNSGSDLAKLYAALDNLHKQNGIWTLREQVAKVLEYLKAEVWWRSKQDARSAGRDDQ